MKATTVRKIRQFNRLYMPVFDLLGNKYLGSEYSATEARILFEIYENDGCNAKYVSEKMNIDKSYLSRILKNHQKVGYLIKTASKADNRAYELHLTEKGRQKTEELIRGSNVQIGRIIEGLSDEECRKLIEACDTILNTLMGKKERLYENSPL